jgi:GNAT superfamily N-acetyltransferase
VNSDRSIENLRSDHPISAFDGGQIDLNNWLQKFALQNQGANGARTYVGLAGAVVVGYYSLAVGQVEYEGAAPRLQKGLARHPIPVMLLARLAVHKEWQRQGVGQSLLRDAILRTVQASEIAGIRALVVHAKDEAARRYYQHFDFAPSPTDRLHLYALVKGICKQLQ